MDFFEAKELPVSREHKAVVLLENYTDTEYTDETTILAWIITPDQGAWRQSLQNFTDTIDFPYSSNCSCCETENTDIHSFGQPHHIDEIPREIASELDIRIVVGGADFEYKLCESCFNKYVELVEELCRENPEHILTSQI